MGRKREREREGEKTNIRTTKREMENKKKKIGNARERGKLEVMEIALEAKVKGSVSKGKTKERN